jgi:signal transduction histidine kinase
MRLTLRTRLTLIYGSLFLATGVALLTVTYVLTVRAIDSKFRFVAQAPLPTDLGPGVASPQQRAVIMGQFSAQVNEQRHAVLNQLIQSSALTMVALGLLAVVLGYLVAGRSLRPLQKVTATARRLSETNLHERIGHRGPRDEIKELADTFDGMLDRLHRAFESQRRFIANASHELRTPLAINRAVIEVALAKPGTPDETRSMGRKLLGTTSRHERLIEGLLLLARSERGLVSRTPVDAADLAGDAVDELTEAAERAGVTIVRALSPAVTAGDVVLLERCIGNLVENAIKYNVADGRVWVMSGQADGWSYVRVENTGPPVPPDQTSAIFEPFRRLRSDRTGSARGAGLGLSIVRAVVRAHGGGVQVISRPKGGLAITLALPVTPSELLSRRVKSAWAGPPVMTARGQL